MIEASRFARVAACATFAATLMLPATPVLAEKLEGVPEAAQVGDIVFSMDRKGKDIGHHSVTYTPLEDGRLQVDIAIAIKVKFAFITAYRYEHSNREIWSADGETLLSIETHTNNNGTNLSVSGKRDGDVFTVTAEDGTLYEIEGPVVPTSYWNAALLTPGSSILNTQKGVVTQVAFDMMGDSAVGMPSGTKLAANLYEAKGELRDIFVDYAQDGRCWIGLEFFPPKQDVKISYALEQYFPTARPDLAKYAPIAPCLAGAPNLGDNA